jgi:hypothetical protein
LRAAPVAGEGGRLGPLLEFEVLEPDVDGVLEARLSHPRSDLLLGFHLRNHPAHLSVGTLLVEEAIADPAAVAIRLSLREPSPSVKLQ